MHESKFPFVSRIEFIRSKLSNFSAHVYGANLGRRQSGEMIGNDEEPIHYGGNSQGRYGNKN